MPASAPSIYSEAFAAGLSPDPVLSVTDWANRNRILSARSSAEPGPFRSSRTPYVEEPMDLLSVSSPVEQIVLMWAAQVAKTETGNNWIGYIVDQAPGPTMYVQPTVELAKRASKQRLDPLFEDTPSLQEKVKDRRSRDSGNTTLQKSFPGGDLVLTGANSAVGLRSMPIRNLFCDEIDSYPGDAEGEGDPVLLAKRGTRTFARRKILLTSTPTIHNRSRIEHAFEQGDQCYYLLPCPECGHKQRLVWTGIDYSNLGTPAAPVYVCEGCGVGIPERFKTQMLAGGEWVATNPDAPAKIRSFHLSALYSPLGWFSWAECVELFLESKGRPATLRVFVNTVLGECWAEEAEAPDWEVLWNRREDYKIGRVPRGGIVLTVGVDVQADRLEAEVVAWGRDRESWSVDFIVMAGDTDSAPTEEPWRSLSQLLDRHYPSERGPLVPISRMAVDAAYRPQPVYAWIRRHRSDRVMATRGQRDDYPVLVGQPSAVEVLSRGKRLKRGVKLWPLGVGIGKSELYGWLRIPQPPVPDGGYPEGFAFPPGYCHLPHYPQEWFEQLTAEELVARILRGYRRYTWEKKRERNEALDCRVYARAAAATLGIDRWAAADWTSREGTMDTVRTKRKRAKRRSTRGGWLDT